MNWWWIVFCGMVCRPKSISLISGQDHCLRFLLLQISDTPQAGFDPSQNLSVAVITTTLLNILAKLLKNTSKGLIFGKFLGYRTATLERRSSPASKFSWFVTRNQGTLLQKEHLLQNAWAFKLNSPKLILYNQVIAYWVNLCKKSIVQFFNSTEHF